MSNSVLVTGTSSGIGEACTRLLAENGFRVYAGVRNPQDRDKWAGDDRIVPVALDLASPEQIQDAVHQIANAAEPYPLYAVVNNAGIMLTGSVVSLALDRVRQVFEVNLFGHWRLTQLCLPLLRTTRGRVINIGSTNGRMAGPTLAAYSATKHALEALSEALQLEVMADGISVSVIEPGAIGTPLWDKVLAWEFAADSSEPGPPDGPSPRREKLERLRHHSRPAAEVARTVLRALQADRPRYRYLVGGDAWRRVAMASLLPRSLRMALRRFKR